MDVVADFAQPLPFAVIGDVLGVPPEDRDWLAEALAVLNRGFARQRGSDRTAVQAANDAAGQPLAYFAALLDQRTAEPADDLMTALPRLAVRTPPEITASVPIRQIDHFTITWQQD
jgi:biflaviolin synthase